VAHGDVTVRLQICMCRAHMHSMQDHGVTVTVCRFVRNIGAICTYAFAGTFVSTVAIAFIM
jgi:hypothetical protein